MTCPNCSASILDNYYFCPNCGKKLKEPPFKFSTSRTVYILLLSTLLPPFGVIPSIKYMIAPDIRAKVVGIIGLILNIAILAIATIYLISTINNSVEQLNLLTNPQGSIEQQVQSLQ